jgi:myosin heavy subunit
MGEILPPEENKYSEETLKWDCVKFQSENSVVIQLNFPKSGKNPFCGFISD